jgi:hypothetical protein
MAWCLVKHRETLPLPLLVRSLEEDQQEAGKRISRSVQTKEEEEEEEEGVKDNGYRDFFSHQLNVS